MSAVTRQCNWSFVNNVVFAFIAVAIIFASSFVSNTHHKIDFLHNNTNKIQHSHSHQTNDMEKFLWRRRRKEKHYPDANENFAKEVTTDKKEMNVPPLQLSVVWLMTFPNSGTTYTLHAVQDITTTTTATNYGHGEQIGYDTSVPIAGASELNGPFYRYPNNEKPNNSSMILTKTHCDSDHIGLTVDEFEFGCRSGTRRSSASGNSTNTTTTKHKTLYSVNNTVVGAVHLLRNPFDNIIARMHFQQRKWSRSKDEMEQRMAEHISPSAEGFHQWCNYVDAKTRKKKQLFTNDNETRQRINYTALEYTIQDIPCYLEFIRYFEFHALTVETIKRNNFTNNLVLYYEDYGNNDGSVTKIYTNTTTTAEFGSNNAPSANMNIVNLLEFLGFSTPQMTMASSPPFHIGEDHSNYYTMEQRELVHRLAKDILLSNGDDDSSAWNLLERYFI